MRNSILIIFLIPFIAAINSCTRCSEGHKGKSLKGEITISGAFALYPMTVMWAEEFKKINPDVEIDISAGGAGKGMTDVLSDMVDLAMVSRELKKEEINRGAWTFAVVKDAVVPIINAKNPVIPEIKKRGVTRQQLIDIFINNGINSWGDLIGSQNKIKIDVFTRSDACGAGEMWGKYLGKNQESLVGLGVYGDPGITDAVKKDINGVGYNNLLYAYDSKTRTCNEGIVVLPIDINENGILDHNENFYDRLDSLMDAIQNGHYPSPPARDLYFVSKGRPHNKIVREFLHWVLTDGQKFVREAGYVQISDTQKSAELKKLKIIHWPIK